MILGKNSLVYFHSLCELNHRFRWLTSTIIVTHISLLTTLDRPRHYYSYHSVRTENWPLLSCPIPIVTPGIAFLHHSKKDPRRECFSMVPFTVYAISSIPLTDIYDHSNTLLTTLDRPYHYHSCHPVRTENQPLLSCLVPIGIRGQLSCITRRRILNTNDQRLLVTTGQWVNDFGL